MSSDIHFPVKGSCNCGHVQYEVLAPFRSQAACHCTQCQKHTQSAFSLAGVLKSENFRLCTGKLKVWTKEGDSGKKVDCYFCPECGNRIYHQPQDKPWFVILKLGTLDNTDIINPQAHIWTRSKQRWFQIPEGVPVNETQTDG